MQILSITSGKGGVGKTNLICNMALQFGRLGRSVLLIDADMGLANVDILLGLRPTASLKEFFAGELDLESLLLEGPPGVTVLPAASGVQSLTHLRDEQVLQLLSGLDQLQTHFDMLLLDTGAGIGKNVLFFNSAAQEVIVVATPEPTSFADAYATMKVLSVDHGVKRFLLIVNQVGHRRQAIQVYRRLSEVADQYLDISIDFLGFVPRDERMSQAVIKRQLILEAFPKAPASQAILKISEDLAARPPRRGPSGNLQFFWRRLLGAK